MDNYLKTYALEFCKSENIPLLEYDSNKKFIKTGITLTNDSYLNLDCLHSIRKEVYKHMSYDLKKNIFSYILSRFNINIYLETYNMYNVINKIVLSNVLEGICFTEEGCYFLIKENLEDSTKVSLY